MTRKIRFPLKMTNGTEVRTIDELRADFDLTAVLGYYADGKLVTWLRDRYLDSEADKIEALDKNSKSFQNDLCAVFGMEASYDSDNSGKFDEEYIKRRNEKRHLLGSITDDEPILSKVDSVAFNQDDLYEIYDGGKKEIYLCQGEFEIPLSVTNVTYIGIDNPLVTVRATDNVNLNEKNINFIDCVYGWDVSATSELDEVKQAEKILFKGEYKMAAKILEKHAENGNPRAIQLEYFICTYFDRDNQDWSPNSKRRYYSELGSESQEVLNVLDLPACDWDYDRIYSPLLKKLADRGDSFAACYYAQLLSTQFLGDNNPNNAQSLREEILKYYTIAIQKGNPIAMYTLAVEYNLGTGGIGEDKTKYLEFLNKAANLGIILAQDSL